LNATLTAAGVADIIKLNVYPWGYVNILRGYDSVNYNIIPKFIFCFFRVVSLMFTSCLFGFLLEILFDSNTFRNAYYNITKCPSPYYIRSNYYCWVNNCAPGVANPPKDCYDQQSGILCQHGQGECVGNDWEMCVVDMYTDGLQIMDFIYCYEITNSANERAIPGCASFAGMDYQRIQQCYNDKARVNNLQIHYANATASLGDSKQGVPWILINGVVLNDVDQLLTSVCKAYKGIQPAGCQ
jgi:hypothetical protein